MRGLSPATTRQPVTTLILLLAACTLARAQAPEETMKLRQTRSSGAQYIKARNYPGAIAYLRDATKRYPEDSELRRLLGVAAFLRALELNRRLDTASAHLAALLSIRTAIVKDSTGAFKATAPAVEDLIEQATRECESLSPLLPQLPGLLEEAQREARRAATLTREFGPTALAAWVNAYRIVHSRWVHRLANRLARMQEVGGARLQPLLAQFRQPQGSVNEEETRRETFQALEDWSRANRSDPAPFLTAAEWILLTDTRDSGHPTALDRIRVSRYRDGLRLDAPQLTPEAVKPEASRLLNLRVETLERVQSPQTLALLERAHQLDKDSRHSSWYLFYLQMLPADRQRAVGLLESASQRTTGNALLPLERARLTTVDLDYRATVSWVNRAGTLNQLSRALFVTVPREVRAALLSSAAVWKNLGATAIGFDGVTYALSQVGREVHADERRRHWLSDARLGGVLMLSDLPHDWALGASLRQNALAQLVQEPELPEDLRTTARLQLAEARAAVEDRGLPFEGAILSAGRIRMLNFGSEGVTLQAPGVYAPADGPVMVAR